MRITKLLIIGFVWLAATVVCQAFGLLPFGIAAWLPDRIRSRFVFVLLVLLAFGWMPLIVVGIWQAFRPTHVHSNERNLR